ncbi:MAG: MCE family protein, partial [Mycobacterium sp.]
PGKRAPTVEMCESDEQYVPLNDGLFWKGDPNATLSGQSVPQYPKGGPPYSPGEHWHPPAEPPVKPPVAIPYDPATGNYVGPDGRHYSDSDLAFNSKGKTWQSMMVPPNKPSP